MGTRWGFIFWGCALGVFFGALEAVIHMAAFGGEGVQEALWPSTGHDLAIRLGVFLTLVLAGYYVQLVMGRQQRISRDLSSEKERLRALIDATPDFICFQDGQGRWLEANEADRRLFGLSTVDYAGKTTEELVDFAGCCEGQFLICHDAEGKAWESREPLREDLFIHKGGRRLTYDVIRVPLFDPDGGRKGLVILGRDVTEHRAAEQALEASHRGFAAVMNSVDARVFVSDLETDEILFVNAYIEEHYGPIVGQPCWKAFHPGRTAHCEGCPTKDDLLAQGAANQVCVRERCFPKAAWFECRDRVIRWTDGRVARVQIATDITERKQAEAEREALVKDLREALEKVHTLRGLLPICASCKKIRDDQGYWHQLEVYISQHSDADFSHGICPDCLERLYPEDLPSS